MPSENTRFWEKLSKTDPDHTKHVGQRGGFTAIDPTYRIQRITEVFGPCGEGWGWNARHSTLTLPDNTVVAIADVEVWWADLRSEQPKRSSYGPVRGINYLLDPKGRLDEDGAKKALTDALTKGFQMLGDCADVYLGLYDDNRYVQGLRNEKRTAQRTAQQNGGDPPQGDAEKPKKAKVDGDCQEVKRALQAHVVVRNRHDGNCQQCDKEVAANEAFVYKIQESDKWRCACGDCVSSMAHLGDEEGR